MVQYQVENVEEQLCYKALVEGKVLSHDVKEASYTVVWLNNIYNFIAGFTGDSFMISHCQRIKKN